MPKRLMRPLGRLGGKRKPKGTSLLPSRSDGSLGHSTNQGLDLVQREIALSLDGDVDDDEDRMVTTLESYIRQALLMSLAFLIGTVRAEWTPVIRRAAEYLTVAWITCLVLIIMTMKETRKENSAIMLHHSTSDERIPLLEQGDHRQSTTTRQTLAVTPRNDNTTKRDLILEELIIPIPDLPHPALEPFHVINHDTNERIIPNNGPYRLENSMWSGQVVLLIRTPDVDDPDAILGTEANNRASEYFRGKQRRFEFQFQLTLKNVPKGRVFFACELEEPIKMGMIQRAFVGAAMAFMKKMNNTFHYSITGQKPVDNGMYEKPHMAFTVEGSMDRLVVTKSGEKPPTLGGLIYEDPESIKRRKKGGTVDWNTQDTYTFALWSAYVDFLEWKSLNLPGIRPFLLTSVIGNQHMNLVIYDVDEAAEKHYRADMNLLSGVEMCNSNQTRMGPRAKQSVGQPATASQERKEDKVQDHEEDFDDDLDDEAATVAELGEGLYLRSGDSVVLQESVNGGGRIGGTVSSGGGFAIIQNNAPSTIVIEKARPSKTESKRITRQSPLARQKLIKTGDTVLVKLVTLNKNNKTETRYLSIHRGWWLKWVTDEPTKNGYFTIQTLESEFCPDRKPFETSETQSAYLTLGGTFSLRHKRWEGYQVGVSAQESPTYGGRMLGIFSPLSQDMGDGSQSDNEPDAKLDTEENVMPEKGNWLNPLRICAHITNSSMVTPTAASTDASRTFTFDNVVEPSGSTKLIASSFQVDVPIWIEIMNRSERCRQLAYVVRVVVDDPLDKEVETQRAFSSFVRLRTGRELAGIMRLGMSWRGDENVGKKPWLRRRANTGNTITPRHSHRTDNEETDDEGLFGASGFTTKTHDSASMTPQRISKSDDATQLSPKRIVAIGSFEGLEQECDFDNLEWSGDVEEQSDLDIDENDEDEEYVELEGTSDLHVPQKQNKGRLIIGQIAKSVKSGTVTTGIQVMKHSKKAGKVLVGPISRARPKKPPATEPKSRKVKPPSQSNRRKEKDHHLVLSRTLKQMEKRKQKSKVWLSEPPRVLAGQLSPPDQSCRTASHVLSRMSPSASNGTQQFASILAEQIADQSDMDRSFLQGGAAQLGVVCLEPEKELLFNCVAARCLWDSHWREEWLGVYQNTLVFFAPLTKKASLQLYPIDVQKVRVLGGSSEYSPLPGYPVAVIETAWQCYYAAFPNKVARDTFIEKVSRIIVPTLDVDEMGRASDTPIREKDLWKARFWQGFHDSAESALSGGKQKWAKVTSGSKMLDRSVLNGRRFGFDTDLISLPDDDLDTGITRIDAFVGNLLSMALSFTSTSLEKNPSAFVNFLDMTCQLRSLPLQHLDLSKPQAFCIFVNIYHCLLQHSLVVTVNGPLFKSSVGHYMRTTCYEIGGDVFSLAELHHCVIRGKTSRPTLSKYPYLEPPRKSNSYRFYALDFHDPRVNFLMNTGDTSCPISIPVLQTETLDDQLNTATTAFIQKEVDIDKAKGTVVLPKICDVYRYEFGNGDNSSCLNFCLKFLDEEDQRAVREFKENVKFQPCSEQYHLYLKPIEALPVIS